MKRLLFGLILLVVSGVVIARAQVASCDASGKQVVARRWDVVLGHEWEMVRDCRHPEWPARAKTVKGLVTEAASANGHAAALPVQVKESTAVHAGETVRLWQQATFVRMEMSGVAEQTANCGEHIQVRVTRHNDDGSSTTARISGTVRATGDVEMDQ